MISSEVCCKYDRTDCWICAILFRLYSVERRGKAAVMTNASGQNPRSRVDFEAACAFVLPVPLRANVLSSYIIFQCRSTEDKTVLIDEYTCQYLSRKACREFVENGFVPQELIKLLYAVHSCFSYGILPANHMKQYQERKRPSIVLRYLLGSISPRFRLKRCSGDQ